MSETGEVALAAEPTPVTDTDISTSTTETMTNTSSTESIAETPTPAPAPAAEVQEKTVEHAVETTPERSPTSTSEPPAETSSSTSTSEEPISQPHTESTSPLILTEATPPPDIATLSPASTAVFEAELAAATELSAHHVIPRRLTAEEAAILVTSTPEQESEKEKEMGATVPDDVDENIPVTTATPVDIVVTEPDEISTTRSLDAVTDRVPSIDPVLLAAASDAVIETSQRIIDAHASPRDHVPDVSAAVDAAQAAGIHPASLIDTARTSLVSEEDETSDTEPIDEASEDEDDIQVNGSTSSLPPLHSGTHTKKGSLEVMVSEPKSPTSTTTTSTTSTPIIEPTSTPPITFITPSVTPDLENESDVADDSDDPKPAINAAASTTVASTSTSTSTATSTSTSTSSLRTSSAPSTPAGTPVVSPTPVSVSIPGLPLSGRVSDSSSTGLAVGGTSSRVVTTPSKPTHTPSISSVTLPSSRNHSPSIFSSLLGRGSRDPSPSQRSASPSPDGSPRVPLCSNCVSKPYKNGLCKLHYQNLKREAEQKSRELKDHAKREQKAEKDRQKAAEKQAKLLKKSQKDSKKVGHQSAPAALGGKSSTDGLSIQDALLIELRDAWKKANKVVFKDVPRLAKRTTVQVHVDGLRGLAVDCGRRVEIVPVYTTMNDDSKSDVEGTATRTREMTATPAKTEEGGVSLLAPTSAPTTKTVVGKDVTVWEAVTNVVLAVAKQLETSDKYDAAAAKFAKLGIDTDSASDFQGLLEDLFTSTLGLDSPTFAVFRAVHQSILFPPIFHLKTKLYNQLGDTMKDVRRDDGWTIHIYIGEAVYVTHTRWEQSMNDEKSPEHFEVQWQVRLSFDRKMQDLRASFLRIQELSFHEQINPERKKQIQGVLRGGGYMV